MDVVDKMDKMVEVVEVVLLMVVLSIIAVAVEVPVPVVPASAVPSEWVQSKKRVRTFVDGVPQTYTGAAAYAVLRKGLE